MRYRTETRHRQVPHTIDGRTALVNEPYTVRVPVPPRDWDRTIRGAVTAAAGAIAAASIVWTTASIGTLLDLAVATGAAYAAAAVFDLVWLSCMALEWLARYNPARAQLPRRAGWAALAVAMVAVVVEGDTGGHVQVGLVGATVSGLAKLLWTLVLRHYATPLDSRTQQWVDAQLAEAGGQLAMVAVYRELARTEGLVAAERAALASPDADPDRPDESADSPDADVLPLPPSALTTKDAVRTAWDSGIRDEDQIRRAASKALGRPVSPDTVGRYVRALKVGA